MCVTFLLNILFTETQSRINDLGAAMEDAVGQKSAITRLSVTLKESAHDFENISYRLGRFGVIWEAVSDHEPTASSPLRSCQIYTDLSKVKELLEKAGNITEAVWVLHYRIMYREC